MGLRGSKGQAKRTAPRDPITVENICPRCSSGSCVQFLTVDGKEIHLNCIECNRVYSAEVPQPTKPGELHVTQWREIGSFVRL